MPAKQKGTYNLKRNFNTPNQPPDAKLYAMLAAHSHYRSAMVTAVQCIVLGKHEEAKRTLQEALSTTSEIKDGPGPELPRQPTGASR